jgi:hypothetical protein
MSKGLSKQVISFPLAKGIDARTDRNAANPDKLAEAINVEFDAPGSLRKRNGSDKLPQAILGSTDYVSSSVGLHRFNDELLNHSSDGILHGHIPSLGQWREIGYLPNVLSATRPVALGTQDQRDPQIASDDDNDWFTWREGVDDIFVTVQAIGTGQVLIPPFRCCAGSVHRMVTYDHRVYLISLSASTIEIRTLSLNEVAAADINVDLAISGVDAVGKFDCTSTSDHLWIVYTVSGGSTTILRLVAGTGDGALSGETIPYPAIDSTGGLSCCSSATNIVCFTALDASSRMTRWALNDNLNPELSPQSVLLTDASDVPDSSPPGSPVHWFRSDRPEKLNGGSRFKFIDNSASTGSLVQETAGSRPIANTSQYDNTTAYYAGGQFMSSSLTGSNFSFLHDGTGMTIGTSFDVGSGASNMLLATTIGTSVGVSLFGGPGSPMRFSKHGTAGGPGAAVEQINSTTSVASGSVYSAVVKSSTSDGSRFWLNGIQTTTTGGLPNSSPTQGPYYTLHVGNRPTLGDAWIGSINEIVLYDQFIGDDMTRQLSAHLDRWRTAPAVSNVERIGTCYDSSGNISTWIQSQTEDQSCVLRSLSALSATTSSFTRVAHSPSFLCSRPFLVAGRDVAVTVTDLFDQSTSFATDGRTSKALARSLARNSGPRVTDALAGVTNDIRTALEVQDSIDTRTFDEGINTTDPTTYSTIRGGFGVSTVALTTSSLQSIKSHGELHFAASVCRSYDGDEVHETGFLFQPDVSVPIISTDAVGVTGSIAAGSYLYAFGYAHRDHSDKVHRSAPSVYQFVSVPSNSSSLTFDVSSLLVTDRSDVSIIGYRSDRIVASGLDIPLYRFTDFGDPIISDPDGRSVAITDDGSGFSTSNDFLYTLGEGNQPVKQNDAPPPAYAAAAYGNRMWLASSDDVNRIHFSKTSDEFQPLQFTEDFSVAVSDDDSDRVRALSSLDDALVIFKRDRIYSMSGRGPTNTGADNDFIDPKQETSEGGCSSQFQLAQTPLGIVYRNRSGTFLMDKGRNSTYLGADVQRQDTVDATAIIAVPSKAQVRILRADGIALVYDWRAGQWCTWTNFHAAGAALVGDRFYFSRSDGSVYAEASHFRDDTSFIEMRISTSWLFPFGRQGWGRAYRAWLLGDYEGPHNLRVKVSFDGDDNEWSKEASFAVDQLLEVSSMEDWLDPTLPAAVYRQEQFGLKLSKKCRSVKVTLYDEQPFEHFVDYTEGFSINDLSLEVGMKSGPTKLPSRQH